MRASGVKLLSILCATLAVGAWLAPTAGADFGIASFDGLALDREGQASTQAGEHPYVLSTTFELNHTLDSTGYTTPDGGQVKTIQVDLPPGLIGNPNAVSQCPLDVFLLGSSDLKTGLPCPESTQVGSTQVKIGSGSDTATFPPMGVPVYSLPPTPGAAASFGFVTSGLPIFLDAYVVAEDGYHVRVLVRDTSQAIIVLGSAFTLWGVPSDESHDPQRGCSGGTFALGCATERTRKPFLTLPTSCPPAGEGAVTRLRANSWSAPSVFAEASFESHHPPGLSLTTSSFPPSTSLPPDQWGSVQGTIGCENLPFHPSFSADPDTTLPDAPTGLSVDLAFPQDGLLNPDGLATAHLKDVRVTLPAGMTVSPSSADGLEGCSDEQIGFGNDDPALCPPGAKIGTVSATTPVLDEILEGDVFVGTQKSDDPGSGRMFRIFLVLRNEARGLLVKLPGEVRVQPDGQIETVFENNPQFPVSTISVRLKTGPRAPLATPLDCGTKTVKAQLTSWGGQVANLEDSFTIDCPSGLGGFAPSLGAGAVNPTGGAFSPFVVRIDRPDRQQYLAGVSLETPGGIAAKLKDIPLCGEAQAAAGTCPITSRVGTVTVGAGPGSNPFYLQGPVSLTGPYKGAPYGLSVAVRAVAGPFDLGTVVVRQAIFIDPVDAHLTVRSDPLPVIVKGVPVRLRTVAVNVDRPGFTINPTSCAPKQIKATFTSTAGVTAGQSVRFQVGDCASLGFSPKLSMRLTGKKQTTDGKHPGLKAVLTQPRHQAGISAVTVRLPLSLALDPENAASNTLCEFEEGQKAEPNCPRSSIIGRAKAMTPLLNRPLTGNVYFVKNVRIDRRTGRRIRTLPTLLLALRGEVALNVRASTSVKGNKLVSSFPAIPDAPVTRFELALKGGKRGILVVTNGQSVCARKQQANVAFAAHNGKRLRPAITIKTPC